MYVSLPACNKRRVNICVIRNLPVANLAPVDSLRLHVNKLMTNEGSSEAVDFASYPSEEVSEEVHKDLTNFLSDITRLNLPLPDVCKGDHYTENYVENDLFYSQLSQKFSQVFCILPKKR